MIDEFLQKSDLINIIENVNEGVYIVNKDREILFWNKAAEKISGFAKTDVLNKLCYTNILRHVDDNNLALCSKNCPLAYTLTTDQKMKAKVYLHHKNDYRLAVNLKTFPIIHNNETIGAVEVFSSFHNENTLKENYNELQTIAFLDNLTNIYNRRYMEIFLSHKISEFNQFNIPFGLLYFDIDNFKNVNDTYGHNVGDEVLKVISQTGKSILRATDCIARWGGEEFVILLPGVKNVDLIDKAEKLRILIQNSNITVENSIIPITVSIGATIVSKNDTPIQVIDRADGLMYKSKEKGKNLVTGD